MGCGSSHVVAPSTIKPQGTPEEQAVAQLKLLFESIDVDSNKTLGWNELQMALQKNGRLGALMTEAKINPDSFILQKLDTNKDGRVTWEEFESHLKTAAIKQVETTGCVPAAEASVEEKANARLKEVFESIDSNKDDALDQEELARKLSADHEGFKKLLVEAGLNINSEVFEQLDGDSDKRVTWDEFYGKLKAAAKAEVQGRGDVVAAIEVIKEVIKIEPEATKIIKTEPAATDRTLRIEDSVTYMCCL